MIVLDTHAWLWWVVEPGRLSTRAQEALDAADRVGIPAIACLEVATLADRGRIRLRRPIREWVAQALAHPRVEQLPMSAEIALEAGLLDRKAFPGDPADRVIYATARGVGGPLISADKAMKAFDPARVIW